MFDFRERDREILNSAQEIGSFEVIINEDHLSITISKEARDLLEFLKTHGGIEYDDPRIEWCG